MLFNITFEVILSDTGKWYLIHILAIWWTGFAICIDVLNIKLAVFKARKNWHPIISSHRQCQFLLLLPTKTTHIWTSLFALFANLLTQNLLNPYHSLANNPLLLLNPTTINTLEQKIVNIPITNWLPTYVHTVRCHLGSSPI